MPRPGKRYICIDWNYYTDGWADGLSNDALVLFQLILIDCGQRESSGVISRSSLRRLGVDGYWNSLKLLVRSGWIEQKEPDLFYVPSWPKWNEPADRVSARRAADRQRKRLKHGIPKDAFRIPD